MYQQKKVEEHKIIFQWLFKGMNIIKTLGFGSITLIQVAQTI